MKIKSSLLKVVLAGMAILPTFSFAAANNNPVSAAWVMQELAKANGLLTLADWHAVCTSGSITSPEGCYGNIASKAFSKINGVSHLLTTVFNVIIDDVPGSLFCVAVDSNSAKLRIEFDDAPGTLLKCAFFDTRTASLKELIYNAIPAAGTYDVSALTQRAMALQGNNTSVIGFLNIAVDPNNPVASAKGILACIASDASNETAAVSIPTYATVTVTTVAGSP